MDPLSQFLTGPRAQVAFTLRVVMDPPFSIDVRDGAALTVIVAVSGIAWIAAEGSVARSLRPGQAATVRRPVPYRVTDAPGREPTVVIGAGQSCRTPAGDHLEITMSHSVRTWGNSPHGDTVLLIGTYQQAAAAGQLVTSALPALAVFDEQESNPVLLELLERELTHPGLGQQSALDRVLDLQLLHLVRVSVDRAVDILPSWATGTRDPMVARFHTAVGQPPMAYLTTWRLALAADRLASSAATTAVIAEEVGYSNAFTFSTAFSRVYGISPTSYRRSAHDSGLPQDEMHPN